MHLVRSVIHSACTVLPLLFTAPLFREVMARYRVNPAFLSIIFSMGEAPHPTERGSSYFASSYSNESRASELQYCAYELQYIEDNKRSKENPWSTRHIGVYHHRDPALDFDLWILLCSNADGPVERMLSALQGACPKVLQTFYDDPFWFHGLLVATYSDFMRWHLKALGDHIEEQVI